MILWTIINSNMGIQDTIIAILSEIATIIVAITAIVIKIKNIFQKKANESEEKLKKLEKQREATIQDLLILLDEKEFPERRSAAKFRIKSREKLNELINKKEK